MIKPIGPSFWKQETINRTSWHDKNIPEYKKQLPPYEMGTIQTIQELNKKSLQFINKITEAKNKITKPVKKRKHVDANNATTENETLKLQQSKAKLIALAHRQMIHRTDLWGQIHVIQNKLHELEV